MNGKQIALVFVLALLMMAGCAATAYRYNYQPGLTMRDGGGYPPGHLYTITDQNNGLILSVATFNSGICYATRGHASAPTCWWWEEP